MRNLTGLKGQNSGRKCVDLKKKEADKVGQGFYQAIFLLLVYILC
jgi:hypothetical protein